MRFDLQNLTYRFRYWFRDRLDALLIAVRWPGYVSLEKRREIAIAEACEEERLSLQRQRHPYTLGSGSRGSGEIDVIPEGINIDELWFIDGLPVVDAKTERRIWTQPDGELGPMTLDGHFQFGPDRTHWCAAWRMHPCP